MGIVEQAQAMADARFNPQQQAIQSRIGLVNQITGARNQAVNTMGEQGRANIGGAYDTLQGLLGANKDQAMGALNTAGNQIGQGYRDAQQIGASQRDASRSALEALATRMNAGSYAMPVIGGIEAEANQLIQNNADRDATTTGNIRNWAAQSGDVYNRQIGVGHQMRADSLSRFESDLIKAVQENNLNEQEQTMDLNEVLTKLLGERGSYLAEQVNQLGAQEFERSFKQAQLDMQAAEMSQRSELANREMSLKERAMNTEDARYGQMTEKEKLAMQLEAWGMAQGQSNEDRDFGLRRQQLLDGRDSGGYSVQDRIGIAGLAETMGWEKVYELFPDLRPGGSGGSGGTSVGGVRTPGSLSDLQGKWGALGGGRPTIKTLPNYNPAPPANYKIPTRVGSAGGGIRFGS